MSVKNSTKINPHVLLISPFALPNDGGVETHLDKLIKYLSIHHIYSTLLTYQPLTTAKTGKSHEYTKNYQIFRLKWFGQTLFNRFEKYFPLQFLYLFPGLFILSFVYYQRNYHRINCIHAHGLVAALIARILNLFHSKRIVVSTHAIYHFSNRPILRYFVKQILSGFDMILAVSEISRNELLIMGINPSKIKVESKWIDTKTFSPQPKKFFKHKFNIFYVGRLIKLKGVDLILNISTNFPHIGFHIAGSGELESKIKTSASKQNNLFYYGSLDQKNPNQLKQLISLYSNCDYFLSPYLYDEGYSQTLIESLSCGTPLIIPQRGSPPTFLSKKVLIYLPYLPKESDIVKLLKNISKGNTPSKLRTTCRRYALSHFSNSNAKLIVDSYSI